MREQITQKKRNWRRRTVIAALLGVLSIPLANEITRRVGAHVLGSLIEGEATIVKARLGLRRLRVEQVTVWSPGCEQPTLSVGAVTADLSILNGLRRGEWIEEIVVDRLQAQIHFDEAGQLITHLPSISSDEESTEPMTTLPFGRLEVKNARMAIHQTGRQPLEIDGIVLVAQSEASRLKIDATVPNPFAAEAQFHADINIASLEGNSELKVDGLRITSDELMRLPLTPKEINLHPWSATASIGIKHSGSLTDTKRVGLTLQLSELVVSMKERPGLVEANATASLSDGAISAQIAGRILGGTFQADCEGSLIDELVGTLDLSCHGLGTRSLPEGLVPEDVHGELSADTNVTATFSDGMLSLLGNATSSIADASIYGIVFAPITTEIHVDGTLDFEDASDRSSGMLTAAVVSDGVSLEQLSAMNLERLPLMSSIDGRSTKPLHASPWLSELVRPAGQVRGAAQIKIPLASLDDPRTFLANGTIDATGVAVNDVLVRQGKGGFQLGDNRVSVDFQDIQFVDEVNGELSSVTVMASGGLDRDSTMRAELRLDRLSAATCARLANLPVKNVDGEVLAHTIVHCKLNQVSHLDAWQGDAALQVKSIRVDDQALANCEARCQVANGVVALDQFRGLLAGGQLEGNGTCQLVAPFLFRGNTSLNGVSIRQLTSFLGGSDEKAADGSLDVSLVADGAIAPRRWQARGRVTGTELRFGRRPIDDTQLDFHAVPGEIVVNAPANGFLGGNFELEVANFAGATGEVQPPGGPIGPSLSGRLRDIPLPAVARIVGLKERVEGTVSCEFAAHSLTDLEKLDVVAVIESPGISIRDASVKQIHVDVKLSGGQAGAHLSALGFGGDIDLRATADVVQLSKMKTAELQEISALPVNGQAIVSDVKLEELWPVIGQQKQLRPLRGNLTATFERGDAEREQGTVAVGDIKLSNLRWDSVLWSNQIQTDVVLGERLVEIRQLDGQFAGGRVNGRGRVSLDGPRNGSFELSTSRVSLQKALVPIDRRGELASGLVSMRIQGRLGRRPSGRALVSMDRGTVGPIGLARLRVPIDWSLDPAAKSVQWRTTNAGVELGGGRVVTHANGRWNGKLDLSLTSTARRVDTGRILPGNPTAGGGFLAGTFRLNAKRAVDANDFTGQFDATLSDASSLQIPVVSDLTKFLTTLPTTTSFEESRFQGRLGNGMVHLDRVTLAAANVQVLAEGTATLQGRLNLQVMAKTDESGPADKLLELADSPLLMAAPTPLALVAKANNALKDRVVHLRVGGTAARPVIRLEPGRQLGQEAIKFFMNQAIAFRNNSDDMSFR